MTTPAPPPVPTGPHPLVADIAIEPTDTCKAKAALRWLAEYVDNLGAYASLGSGDLRALADQIDGPRPDNACVHCRLPVDVTLSGGVRFPDGRSAHRVCVERAGDVVTAAATPPARPGDARTPTNDGGTQ